MFRSRRTILVRKLAKTVANEAERAVENLLKSLQSAHLETLARAVESRGAEASPCLPLPEREMLRLGRRTIPARFLFCQLYRWPDLSPGDELKSLPCCSVAGSSDTCCNPYHWSRLYKPDSPPPPYSRHPHDLRNLISPPSSGNTISQETGHSHVSGDPHWCSIAYWEQKTRVGRQMPVTKPSINVFSDLPHGDGLCLGTLARTRDTSVKDVRETRKKIGLGVTIFREDQEVWVYNRSEHAVFVNSHTLDPPNTRNLSVYKVLPGYSIKIFDHERLRFNQQMAAPFDDGPFDPCAVRISFVKGWGSKYSRRCITCCPCWLEVIFSRQPTNQRVDR